MSHLDYDRSIRLIPAAETRPPGREGGLARVARLFTGWLARRWRAAVVRRSGRASARRAAPLAE